MLLVLTTLAFTVPAAAEEPADSPARASEPQAVNDDLLLGYDAVRAALVDDSLEQVRSRALGLSLTLAPDPVLAAVVTTLGSAPDLSVARVTFGEFSRLLVLRLSTATAAPRTLVYYCPMFEGYSWWVQSKPGIQNPYMGQAMPQCGEERSLKAAAKAAVR